MLLNAHVKLLGIYVNLVSNMLKHILVCFSGLSGQPEMTSPTISMARLSGTSGPGPSPNLRGFPSSPENQIACDFFPLPRSKITLMRPQKLLVFRLVFLNRPTRSECLLIRLYNPFCQTALLKRSANCHNTLY